MALILKGVPSLGVLKNGFNTEGSSLPGCTKQRKEYLYNVINSIVNANCEKYNTLAEDDLKKMVTTIGLTVMPGRKLKTF